MRALEIFIHGCFMKRFVSLILVFVLLFSLMLALSSCGTDTHSTKYTPTIDELKTLFKDVGYSISYDEMDPEEETGFEDGPYYWVAADNPDKDMNIFEDEIFFFFFKDTERTEYYSKYFYNRRRTFLDELIPLFNVNAKYYSKVAHTDYIVVLYTYDEDYKIFTDFLKSKE